MLISLFSLCRKDTEMWYFRITEISENSQKYNLFVYFRVFSPCEKKGFCAVINLCVLIYCPHFHTIKQKAYVLLQNLDQLRNLNIDFDFLMKYLIDAIV